MISRLRFSVNAYKEWGYWGFDLQIPNIHL